MTKKEWLNAAQEALDNGANAQFNIHNWMYFALKAEDQVVGHCRDGREIHLQNALEEIQKSLEKLSNARIRMNELAKGLIHSVPENIEINEDMMDLFK